MMMNFNIGVAHKTRPYLLADLGELFLIVKYDDTEELSHERFQSLVSEIPTSAEDEDLDSVITELSDCHLEDCWSQFEYRQCVFNDFYPFELIENRLVFKSGGITDKNRIYILLLICARLRSFNNIFRQKAANKFVEISAAAMQKLVGSESDVKIFDANSNDRRSYYTTDLRVALEKLASQLSAFAVNTNIIRRQSSSGDCGLDIVAVRNFQDSASGSFAVFGQCAAQELGWVDKTLEAHPINFETYFTLLNKPENVVFIPVCYRDSNGKWVDESRVSGCLLVDRLRILNLLTDDCNVINRLAQEHCEPVLNEIVGVS